MTKPRRWSRMQKAFRRLAGCVMTRAASTPRCSQGLFTFPHVKQLFRITCERRVVKSGNLFITHACGSTSLSTEKASPERLLSLNRGHWTIENGNHRRRNTAFREDACLARTGHGPANNVAFSNLALAIILTENSDWLPAANDPFQAHRDDALKHSSPIVRDGHNTILAKRDRSDPVLPAQQRCAALNHSRKAPLARRTTRRNAGQRMTGTIIHFAGISGTAATKPPPGHANSRPDLPSDSCRIHRQCNGGSSSPNRFLRCAQSAIVRSR